MFALRNASNFIYFRDWNILHNNWDFQLYSKCQKDSTTLSLWFCKSWKKKKKVKYPVCRQSTLISSIFYVCLFPTEFYFKTYNETLSTQYMVLKRNWPFICVHEWVLIRFDQSWQSDLFCRWLTQKIQLYPSTDTIRLVLWSLCLSTPKFKS